MRKITLTFLVCLVVSTASAQTVYNWLNVQYRPSVIGEYYFDKYLNLNAKVKSISEKVIIENPLTESTGLSREIEFSESGDLLKVIRTSTNGTKNILQFVYHIKGGIEYYTNADLYFNGAVYDTLVLDTFKSIVLMPFPEKEIKSSTGLTVYFQFSRDEVYTRFDKHGRKVLDSVPMSPSNMAHTIKYQYKRKKVVVKESHLDGALKIKTIYKLDSRGNWTQRVVYENKRKISTALRKIIYYNQQ